MHDRIIHSNPANPSEPLIETTEAIEHDDGFRAPDEESEAPYVTWDGEASHQQSLFYLHGALHLYDFGHELQKKCWERSGGIPLVDQIRTALDENRFPLFVSEGDSTGKLERIRHSGYLHTGLRKFRGACDQPKSTLFVFGHSLSGNDSHILMHISKGKIKTCFISIYGSVEDAYNKDIIRRAQLLAAARDEHYPLDLHFFDASSVNVWNHFPA